MLYDIVKEAEILVGGKGDNPSGSFKKWLASAEGQKALSRGVSVEMEHTEKSAIAREIATDHLKEDRHYYEKLAKAGLDESSMGVAGPMIANPEVDPGTGIPVMDPLRKSKRNKKNVPAKRLTLGSPANGGMVGTNPMVPGRSAFAKAIEGFIAGGELVAEMFIEGRRSLKDGAFILAYRSKIWVFPDEESMNEASKKMMASIRKETKVKKFGGERSDLEERPDILMATYHSGERGRARLDRMEILKGLNFAPQAGLSPLVAKVAKALGVQIVLNQGEEGDVVNRASGSNLKPKKPTWGYHGTSTKHLKGILLRGISPQPHQTNFKNVEHHDTVFLTIDPEKAAFHAQTAVPEKSKHRSGYGLALSRTNSMGHHINQPIILKVKIPDPALLTADYDIDREGSQQTYTDMLQGEKHAREKGKIPGDPTKVSHQLGVFGYRGRILPQMITDVYIGAREEPDTGEPLKIDDMMRFDPARVLKALKQADEHGVELDEIDLKDFIQMPNEFIMPSEEDDNA
jgi:hypothetical protein